MEDTNIYGVKILYTYTVNDDVFYEESILRVRAESFEQAYARAEEYAKSRKEKEYKNADGLAVRITYEAVDCFHIQEEGDAMEEVYSAFSKTAQPDFCDAEDLRILRRF